MERIIDVKNLSKAYGHSEAVRNISFYVNRGEMVAILGPNGAGKSTTINILCTLIGKDSGSVVINGGQLGIEDAKIRNSIGVVFQNGTLDEMLTIRDNLLVRGHFYQKKNQEINKAIENIARQTEISSILNQEYGKLSGGQKRRCDIARALIHNPAVLILDEPATGLDPQMRYSVWKTIEAIKCNNNTSIVLTTHYMEEASKADYIIVMKDGRIITRGTPYELMNSFSRDYIIFYTSYCNTISSQLSRMGLSYIKKQNKIKINLRNTMEAMPLIERFRGKYSGFEVIKGSLEDAYLSIVGGSNSD